MKILHIIEIRGIGGAENLLLDFLPAQVRLGHDISCLILYMTQYEREAVDIGKKLKIHNVHVGYIKFHTKLSIAVNIFKAYNYIKTSRPDVIHTHLRVAELMIAFLTKISLKIPVITTVHGFADSKKHFALRQFIVNKLYKNFNGIAFISNFMNAFFQDHNLINKKSITQVIYNGYDTSYDTQSNISRNDKENIKIILPGRLTELKGHRYAIDAVKELIKTHPNIILDIYGSGPYGDNIKNLIISEFLEDNIFLKGFSMNIKSLLPNYDVVLLPTLGEPFGMVFLEAFAAKVPVVAFDLPAGNEIIKNGFNGLLAEPYSSMSLAQKVENLIEDNNLQDSIVKNATKVLNEKFTIDKMVIDYTSLYMKVVNKQ
jgi:glycosyltransferase involved in cell wall biosynthesis